MKEITPNARGIYAIQVNLKIDKIKLIIALAKRIITNIFLYSGSLVKLFESLGYIAKLTPPTNDGGYDILLTRGGEKTIVECKCYSIGHKVGRPNIQKLVGANNVVLADKMIFITTSDFSSAAISYAEEVEVKLINGNKLMELLHKQGFIEKEKVKINVMECQLETADLYPYVPRDIYESFFE